MKQPFLLKLLILIFIFILTVFLIIFIFIVPSVKELKEAKIENIKAFNRYKIASKRLKSRQIELKNLKHNNLKILIAFQENFDKKDFLKFASKYFKKVELIEDKNSTYKKDFTEYNFNTISSISDPTVFYKFLTDLNRYRNIIKTDFPIQMEAAGDDINTTFKLKVYKLKKSKK